MLCFLLVAVVPINLLVVEVFFCIFSLIVNLQIGILIREMNRVSLFTQLTLRFLFSPSKFHMFRDLTNAISCFNMS